ncbi:25595_t:CDS:2 [Gigaspora margarita]|uniref:25595_t:CDS:1 n=1 Tax=Gigaspora margarita TaxID=4874 RepID=A0ABN7VW84_GIGMA|nr:25595_t:CDS:2 [Gigaspora margarita]
MPTTTAITNKETLLQRENEYLLKKINEELNELIKNNYGSTKHTVISIAISSLALLIGIVLLIFEKSNFGQEIKNIIPTFTIGAGSSLTLFGSLTSLKNLFKQVNKDAEEFKTTLNMFKDLYKNRENKEESIEVLVIVTEVQKCYEEQKKYMYKFLDGLNKHLKHMSICRSITSLIFIILAIISTFYLNCNNDEYIFEIIDILLIFFSSLTLCHSICVMICIQVIIPNMTKDMLDDDQYKYKYKPKVRLSRLIGFLYGRIQKEKGLSKLIKDFEFKRINMGNVELEGIIRVLYGLPLDEESWLQQKREIKRIKNIKLSSDFLGALLYNAIYTACYFAPYGKINEDSASAEEF